MYFKLNLVSKPYSFDYIRYTNEKRGYLLLFTRLYSSEQAIRYIYILRSKRGNEQAISYSKQAISSSKQKLRAKTIKYSYTLLAHLLAP